MEKKEQYETAIHKLQQDKFKLMKAITSDNTLIDDLRQEIKNLKNLKKESNMIYTKIIEKIETELYKLREKYFSSDKGIEEDEFSEIVENIEIDLKSLKIEIRDHLREIKYLSEKLAAYEEKKEIENLKKEIEKQRKEDAETMCNCNTCWNER